MEKRKKSVVGDPPIKEIKRPDILNNPFIQSSLKRLLDRRNAIRREIIMISDELDRINDGDDPGCDIYVWASLKAELDEAENDLDSLDEAIRFMKGGF